jgi:hypothetical protein
MYRMGEVCSIHQKIVNIYRVSAGNSERNRRFQTSRCRHKYENKIYFKEIMDDLKSGVLSPARGFFERDTALAGALKEGKLLTNTNKG